jgi:hypothetical protein
MRFICSDLVRPSKAAFMFADSGMHDLPSPEAGSAPNCHAHWPTPDASRTIHDAQLPRQESTLVTTDVSGTAALSHMPPDAPPPSPSQAYSSSPPAGIVPPVFQHARIIQPSEETGLKDIEGVLNNIVDMLPDLLTSDRQPLSPKRLQQQAARNTERAHRAPQKVSVHDLKRWIHCGQHSLRPWHSSSMLFPAIHLQICMSR